MIFAKCILLTLQKKNGEKTSTWDARLSAEIFLPSIGIDALVTVHIQGTEVEV